MDTEEEELYLLLAAFPSIAKAQEAHQTVLSIKKEENLYLIDIALVMCDKDNNISISESEDVDAKRGAVFGGIIGFLVGLLAGPLGAIIALPTGAILGGIAAHAIDMGIPNHRLKELADTLKPGTAEVLVVANEEWTTAVAEQLEQMGGDVLVTPLSTDFPQRVNEIAEQVSEQ